MLEMPSRMLNNLSKLDKKVVINWWKTLTQKVQEELIILYNIDKSENQSFASLSYYIEFIEKEQIQDFCEYLEELREFYVNHEVGLNYKLEELNKFYGFRGGVASTSETRYKTLLKKYIYPHGYYTLFSI